MSIIIDTNIITNVFLGNEPEIVIDFHSITSINALEFLQNIEKIYPNKAKYYLPIIRNHDHMSMFSGIKKYHSGRPFNKRLSDSVLFDFNNDYPSYSLYNNSSIAETINNNYESIFYQAIDFLPKEKYKSIKTKFQFIISKNISCVPITPQDISLGYSLLNMFLRSYQLKGDFRNCWNDFLILAHAINTASTLITEDDLLNQFASKLYGGEKSKALNKVVEIKFPGIEKEGNKQARIESKNYINRGWNYKIRSGK